MPLPGDKTHASQIDQMLRVNHAGEYGAQQIYKGQLAILGSDASIAPMLEQMAAQESAHLRMFEKLITERRARPTFLLPLWHVAGYALGAGTALLGREAAMACTVAVERVISEHYSQQEMQLGSEEAELKDTIRHFRAEEEEHHATGLEQGAENAPAYGLLSAVIGAGCRAAIAITKRI